MHTHQTLVTRRDFIRGTVGATLAASLGGLPWTIRNASAAARSSLVTVVRDQQALRGEPWPLSPPPLCVEAADKVYGLGTSNLEEITITPIWWQEDLLL